MSAVARRRLARGQVAWKTIVLWLFLVVLFVAFYQFFRQGPGEGSGEAPSPGGDTWSIAAWVVVVVVVFLALLWFRNRWTKLNQRGVELLADGRYAEARRCFEEAARKSFGNGVPRFNVAVCDLYLGDLAGAAKVFEEQERKGTFKKTPAMHRRMPNMLALCTGLLGDLPAARRWVDESAKRKEQFSERFALLSELVLLCREGHLGAVVQAADARWREVEADGGVFLRLARLLRAFALHGLDASGNEPQVFEAIAGAKPMAVGELDGLASRWPELLAFFEAQGLSSPRKATA